MADGTERYTKDVVSQKTFSFQNKFRYENKRFYRRG